jgi:uncharacterized membrane protein YcaP (DUF421 family)
MDGQDLLLTAVRASLMYFYLLLIIRLLGKRSVGAVGAFDLVVALMLGEVVDEAIFGDVALVKGLLAITVVAGWHFVNEWVSFRSPQVDRLTAGQPTVLMEHGQFQPAALARERVSQEEVLGQMRLHSIENPADVKRATLETNGQISFLKEDGAEALRKRDLAENGAGG